jgi:hypothetical protein
VPANGTRPRVTRTATDQPSGRRAILVSDPHTYLPGDRIAPTPAGSLAAGLGPLASRIAASFRLPENGPELMSSSGVILIDSRAGQQLGLPVTADQLDQAAEAGADHPSLVSLRAAGWSASKLRDWVTIYGKDRPRIHIGILPLIDPKKSPIICTMPHDTLDALTLWHELIGSAYYGTPGWAGIEALRKLAACEKTRTPTFQPKGTGPDGAYEPEGAYELAFLAEQFRGKLPAGMRWAAAYDARMAYLAACQVLRVAPWSLKHTGRVDRYDPERSGWWLVKFAKWQDGRIPDPAGYGMGEEARWVTGPTLGLIDPLVEQGIHGGYEILDSWTAPIISAGNGCVLKPWAEAIRDGLYSELPGPAGAAVRVALKESYRQSVGSLNNARSPIYRPDWHFAVIAMCRANLWRKMWDIGNKLGRWPLIIETDNVWYPISGENAAKDEAPVWQNANGGMSGMVIGDRLGKVQVKAVKNLRPLKDGASE